jgi:hypothetical protein
MSVCALRASVCALRAVTSSTDGMTADIYPFDMHAFLGRAATRIINEVKGHQPRGLRRMHVEAAGHDRVGMIRLAIFERTVLRSLIEVHPRPRSMFATS